MMIQTPSAINPMQPSSQVTVPPATDRFIRARWLELSPLIEVQSRRSHSPTDLSALAAEHRRRVIEALSLGIELWVLRRSNVDDPRTPIDEFRDWARRYVAKRRKRQTKENH